MTLVGGLVRAEEFSSPEVVDTIAPSGTFNVVTYSAPRSLSVSDLGLKEAGLQGGHHFSESDEIRVFSDKSKLSESPKIRIWLNAKEDNQYWFQTGGSGSASDYIIQTGEVVVVHTRVSKKPVVWRNIFSQP